MLAPKTKKKVRGFLSRLNYITRFISQITTCEPISRLLQKKKAVVWNEEYQEIFDKIKHYLKNPPLLAPLIPSKSLILYLTTTKKAMGCVLWKHDESGGKERMIYYLIMFFIDCESKYTMTEKLY
jgi:hypothetical protein